VGACEGSAGAHHLARVGKGHPIHKMSTTALVMWSRKCGTEHMQMFEIFKEFTFEAAHHLAVNVTAGHRYSRLHGHSFQVQIVLQGEADEKKSWVCDFHEIEQQITKLCAELDHQYLNEIAGLEVPTLENINRWIWNRLDSRLPGLNRIVVRRGSCGEGCVFYGHVSTPSALSSPDITAVQSGLS
jgi:6-pyruvoyltetrahydropterin/6-carboxytetrahydropterin synthase